MIGNSLVFLKDSFSSFLCTRQSWHLILWCWRTCLRRSHFGARESKWLLHSGKPDHHLSLTVSRQAFGQAGFIRLRTGLTGQHWAGHCQTPGRKLVGFCTTLASLQMQELGSVSEYLVGGLWYCALSPHQMLSLQMINDFFRFAYSPNTRARIHDFRMKTISHEVDQVPWLKYLYQNQVNYIPILSQSHVLSFSSTNFSFEI